MKTRGAAGIRSFIDGGTVFSALERRVERDSCTGRLPSKDLGFFVYGAGLRHESRYAGWL